MFQLIYVCQADALSCCKDVSNVIKGLSALICSRCCVK